MTESDTPERTATGVFPPAVAPSPQKLAEVMARYDIEAEIGRGGMGVVYGARHKHLDRRCAIKLCPAGPGAERFRREAKLLARLQSPHVVPVYDFEVLDDGRAVLVMEWIDGSDLRGAMARHAGGVPEATAVPWMGQVCDGLTAADEHRIVHRDLKPSNILIDAKTGRALVADFGLAVAPTVDQLSVTGHAMGTPHYMAPEQAEDPHRVDVRADVYSFGATFYHALTGRLPFDGPSHFSILLKHKTEPLHAPRAVNPRLSPRVAEVVERCLAKSPGERFASFAEVKAALADTGGRSPWEAGDDSEMKPYLDRYEARREVYIGREGLPTPDEYRFPGRQRLTIGFGHILAERVTALVSSDDNYLTMSGGVSAAIGRSGGPQIADEAARYVPVRVGRVVVTSAGRLPARFVFHAVTIRDDGPGGGVTRGLIGEVLESCFYHADTLGVESMALPLLGTGVGGLDRQVCLDTMFRCLARKLLHGVTTVKDVRVVLYARR